MPPPGSVAIAATTEKRGRPARPSREAMSEPSGNRFFTSYEGEPPPWDIGHPQPALVALADQVHGSVIDVGCGTGEHALFYAARGCEAFGIDTVPQAIEMARAKATKRGLTATFQVGDALDLGRLGRQFDQAIDCGVFHVFSDEERPRYVASLGQVLRPAGMLHMLVFNEHTPGDWGPRRVTQAEIRGAFASGFKVHAIDAAELEVNLPDRRPQAWRAVIERTA